MKTKRLAWDSPEGRAQQAFQILATHDTRESLPRAFDNCLEAGDGGKVFAIMADRAASDERLLSLLDRHGLDYFAAEARRRQRAEFLF